MSFAARETSSALGQPVELYRWTHAAETYRYTSAQAAELFDGQSYSAAPIQRGAFAQGEEIARAALEVTVSQTHPVAALFSLGPPVDRVLLTLWRRHAGDAEAVVMWQGRVLSCEWSGVGALLRHEPTWTAIRRAGLRRTWGLQCPHVLYGSACQAAPITVVGAVTGVSGASVTVTEAGGAADGYWAGGTLTRTDAATGRVYRAMIVGHAGTTITLHYPLALAVDDTVTLTAGCDHSLATCDAKFANAVNFGGFPWTPKASPYGGTAIY